MIEGTAYDTDTGELIHAVQNDHLEEAESLYRTRNGAFFSTFSMLALAATSVSRMCLN